MWTTDTTTVVRNPLFHLPPWLLFCTLLLLSNPKNMYVYARYIRNLPAKVTVKQGFETVEHPHVFLTSVFVHLYTFFLFQTT